MSAFAQDDRRANKLEKAWIKGKITGDEYDKRLEEACNNGDGVCCLNLAYRKKSIEFYYKAAKLAIMKAVSMRSASGCSPAATNTTALWRMRGH